MVLSRPRPLGFTCNIVCANAVAPSASRAGGDPVSALAFVMRDGYDLDGVLSASLVHDGVREVGHRGVAHGPIGRETLDERPALRHSADRRSRIGGAGGLPGLLFNRNPLGWKAH